MAAKYYWWEKDQNSGANPFLSGGGGGGMPNPFLSGGGPNSTQQSLSTAQRESGNLSAKEQAVGLGPIEQPSLWSKAGQGALGALHWLFTPIRKTTNALAGGLEETRDYRMNQTPHTYSFADEAKSAFEGIKKGWGEDKQYSFGRYIGNYSSDIAGKERGNGFAPARFVEALLTDHNNKQNQSPLEFATRQYGPAAEGTGLGTRLMDSTLSDLLGFYVEGKMADRMMPVRMGRVKTPGPAKQVVDEAATATAKAAREAEVAALRKGMFNAGQKTSDMVQKLEALGLGTADEIKSLPRSELSSLIKDARGTAASGVTRETLEGIGSKNADTVAKALGIDLSTKVSPIMKQVAGDDTLRRVAQIWDPIRGWSTPAMQAQLKMGDTLASAGRAGLGMLPQGAQDTLGALFRNMETSNTPKIRAMNEAIDSTKQGARTGIRNTEERLFQAMDQLAPNLTDNERRALYYSLGMNKQLDDAGFLQQLAKSFDIPMTELQNLNRLKPFRDFIEAEFQGFKAKGESQGLFKGIEDPYVPIFRKGLGGGSEEVSTNQAIRQQLGGLRSIQKLRTADAETLLERSSQLAEDDIVEALMRYNRTFHKIERTKNLANALEQLGIVSKQRTAGFDTLADAITFGPEGKQAERMYIDKAYKGRLANEELGFLRDSPMAKGLKKVEDITRPWKTFVTTYNPAYHARNAIDDFIRTNVLGEGTLDDYAKTVTRETGDIAARNVRVQDWAKNAAGQWEYIPGVDQTMNLTATEAKALSRAMGASRTHANVIGADSSVVQKAGNFLKDKTGLDIFKDPGQTARESYFLRGLRQQGNAKLAKQIVGNDLIDYADISPFLRDVGRPLAPFATFATKNPAVALEATLRNPGKLAQFDFLREKTSQGDESVYANLPEYLRDQGVLAWRNGQGNIQVFNPGLSQFDWQNMAPAKALKASARLPHPAIQALLGLQRGVDSNGIPIDTAEGFGQKPVSGLAAMLIGHQGPDGGQYADATTKFLYDTILSGPQAMSTAFSDPTSFLTKGMGKQYDEQELILRALLDENRRRTGRLKGFEQAGGQVPTMRDLRATTSANPFLSR